MFDSGKREREGTSDVTEDTIQPVTKVFSGVGTEEAPASSVSVHPAPVRQAWHVLAILSTLMGFGSISTDLYLPAMPAMARSFGAAAGTIELTVSGYLIGFSLGQLFWGPISDRHGRRVPIAIGIALFAIGSAGCALAGSSSALIAWRIVQAVGASAGVVLARAIVRDLYVGNRAAQMLSTLITVMTIAPLVGPLLGGQILLLAGWRSIFWTLVGIGFATLAALLTLPETLPPERRNRATFGRVVMRYGDLIRDRRLLGYAGVGGFFYGGMYAYIAGTPFAYITYHHVPAELYGFLFAASMVGIMLANLVNVRLVMRFGSDRLLTWAAAATALVGILLAVVTWTDWGGLWGLVVPLLVYAAAAGFIIANSIAGAMSSFPRSAGAVSALIGAIHYGSGILSSALLGVFADGTPRPMGCIIALTGIGSLLCVRSILTTEGRKH